MINAFKQIRLTNVNVSGVNGRLAVANSGNLAFSSELNAVESGLNSTILSASGVLNSAIQDNNTALTTASGELNSRITSEVSGLNNTISTASGVLKGYIDERVSGVIDMAPAALDTLNELAAALGDDENFAANLTNTLTAVNTTVSGVSGALDSRITSEVSGLNSTISTASGTLNSALAATGSGLQSQIDAISGSYVTLNTAQTISGDKTFAGTVNFNGGFEVGASEGSAALFVSGSSVGINTEAPTEALDVNGNAKVGGSLFVGSGINANSKVISNVASPVSSGDAANKGYIDSLSSDLSTRLASTGSALDSRITSEVSGLNSTISGVYGSLSSNIATASGSLKSYIDERVSGVIDMAPAALDTLNELAAALGDDQNFASNLTNTLTSINSGVSAVSGALDSRITSEVGSLNSTISSASGVLDSRITSEVSGLNSALSSVSGVLQGSIDTKVASATQKQFTVILPVGIESTGISFPGNVFGSTPSVQVTMEGDVIYQSLIKNRTVSGFDIYFSDSIQEENVYLNVFASNQ